MICVIWPAKNGDYSRFPGPNIGRSPGSERYHRLNPGLSGCSINKFRTNFVTFFDRICTWISYDRLESIPISREMAAVLGEALEEHSK
jgi:hypothetical protein